MIFPYHCARSFHLRHGRRAFNYWCDYTGYIPPRWESEPEELWRVYFPLKTHEYVQLELF